MKHNLKNRQYLVAVLIAVCGLGSGCQSLGFRNSQEASDLAYDDWAISSPQSNPPKVKTPAPSAYAKRRQAEQSPAPDLSASAPAEPPAAAPAPATEAPVATTDPVPNSSSTSEPDAAVVQASAEIPANDPSEVQPASSEAAGPSEAKSNGPVKVSLNDLSEADTPSENSGEDSESPKPNGTEPKGVGQNNAASKSDELNVIDAGVEEIDFEGALADLPAPYRELLRRQLQAAQNSQKDVSQASENGAAKVGSEANANGETTSSKIAIKASLSDASPAVEVGEAILASNVSSAPAPIATQPSGESVAVSEVLAASATLPLDKVPTEAPVANQVGEISFSHWNQALAQSIELLQKQISETTASDENLRFHHEIALRMLFVASRRLDDACTPVDGMSNEENAYLRHQMQALYEASNPDAMPVRSRHLSLVMNSQREATNQLAAASNLEVRSAAFCTEVERFGVVTKFPKYQFVEDQEVLLYCEIENVAAKAIKEGFETQLQGSYEILDAQGQRVSEQILPMEPDFCQNHRRDYFIVYQIYMPQQIQPGNYKLRLTIEDMNARKFGQSTLDFQIKK